MKGTIYLHNLRMKPRYRLYWKPRYRLYWRHKIKGWAVYSVYDDGGQSCVVGFAF